MQHTANIGQTKLTRTTTEFKVIKDFKEQFSNGNSKHEEKCLQSSSLQFYKNSVSAIPSHYINIGSLYNEWNAARLQFNMTHPEFAACLLHLLKNTLPLLPITMQTSVPIIRNIQDLISSKEDTDNQKVSTQRKKLAFQNNSQIKLDQENNPQSCNNQSSLSNENGNIRIKNEKEENYRNINCIDDLPLSIKLEVNNDIEKVEWLYQTKQAILSDPESVTMTQEVGGIHAVNNEVEMLIMNNGQSDKRRKRGNYRTYSAEIRAKIAKYAIEKGNASAVRHFSTVLGRPVSESTVRYIKASYLEKRTLQGDITDLPHKLRGRPTLLCDYENEVQNYLQEVKANGGIINCNIVLAAAHDIIKARAPHLLAEHGGNINLSHHWAASILERMGIN